MVTIKNSEYLSYGKCLEITNGNVVLKVTTEIGPRIIYYGTNDGENMMFADINDEHNRSSEYLDATFKKGEMWHIYGGHRLWKSPEDEASYFPDNYPVDVTLLDNGAIFKSAREVSTGVQKSMKITMDNDGVVTIEHGFHNYTESPVNYALWALSVMNKDTLAICPLSKEDTGLLANRNIVFWPYTNVKDDRLTIEQEYVSLRQKRECDGAIKVGMLNTDGVVYAIRGNKMLEKRFASAKRDGNYADYCSNVEFYTCSNFVEVEVLSELTNIPSGKTAIHKEVWTLHESDETYDKIRGWVNEK